MRRGIPFGLVACTLLAGCGAVKGPLATQAGVASPSWQAVATDNDRARLRGWRDAWTGAVDAVRKAGQGAALDREPALFDPDRALDAPTPPAGRYRCRWYKLGSAAPAVAAFTAYPAVPCTIAANGKVLRFAIDQGDQRPHGLIFADSKGRAVFLGTLELGDERTPIFYGRDEKRDIAGYVERIGEARWRLILPQPHFESQFDVIEITPVA